MTVLTRINAVAMLNALTGQPPAPPIGAKPTRHGNGRVEVLIYPHATAEDRINGAVTLLRGTGFRIVKED